MKFALFTTLFPNSVMPSHGVFVENRLKAYLKKYPADVKVIAPVPWFPSSHPLFGAYANYAKVPERELRNGIEVFHPRYFVAPKVGMGFAPASLERCFETKARDLIDDGWDFDFIDAHYFYPDGVAAARVAHHLAKPIVITGRGTDINLIPAYAKPRRDILEASMRADTIITVADALRDELITIGAPAEKIKTLRNGVDLDIFHPVDQTSAREEYTAPSPLLISVGHLIDRKGHDLAIKAMSNIPGATLLIAGDGPDQQLLKRTAQESGVSDRVRFLGRLGRDELVTLYNASHALILASSREGWPNVLLEAMACGCPCVATDVWGSGEVIQDARAGQLVKERSPRAIAKAVNALLAAPPTREATRAYASAFSWDATTAGMNEIFSALTKRAILRRSVKTSPVFNQRERPKLLVTVDTEEAFDWSHFAANKHSVCPVDDLKPFQSLCEQAGARPLYIVTSPVLQCADNADYFRSLHDQKRADFGLHLHQWLTSSNDGSVNEYYSFQKNYPLEDHAKGLSALADLFNTVFGEPAKAHRAGRYGIAQENYEQLAALGIDFDFSPSPGFDTSRRGGPDFSQLSNHPFIAATPTGKVFVTPVSGAKAFTHTTIFRSQENRSAKPFAPALQNNLLRAMRLTPEGTSLDDLKALTRRLIKDDVPVLTFTLHSTSLTPGVTDYGRDADAIDSLLRTTRDYFTWFIQESGGDIISFDDLKSAYQAARR